MDPISRRDLLAGAAVLSVGAGLHAAAATTEPPGVGPASALAKAYLGNHKPQQLPFDPAKLDGLSEKLIRSHWENNYQGAINALNVIEPKLPGLIADKDWPPYLIGDVKREELLRTGSMIMHALYFGNLGGDGKVSGDIVESLGTWFGSAAAWKRNFARLRWGSAAARGGPPSRSISTPAKCTIAGRGTTTPPSPAKRRCWSATCTNTRMRSTTAQPRPKYVDAFMRNVNWAEVNRRFVAARKANVALTG